MKEARGDNFIKRGIDDFEGHYSSKRNGDNKFEVMEKKGRKEKKCGMRTKENKETKEAKEGRRKKDKRVLQ